MKKTILAILAFTMILAVSCSQNPDPVFEEEPVYPETDVYFFQPLAPYMEEAAVTDSYSFKLQIRKKESVTACAELGSGDSRIIDVTGNESFCTGTGTLWFSQPDSGLGERNWKIGFKVLFDSSSYGEAPSNKVPMYIYDAVGLDEYNEEITDGELGYQASQLNGWFVVEFSDYSFQVFKGKELNQRTMVMESKYDYSHPKAFRLSVMDLSDVSDKTRKISSLAALDQSIIGTSFHNDAEMTMY